MGLVDERCGINVSQSGSTKQQGSPNEGINSPSFTRSSWLHKVQKLLQKNGFLLASLFFY